MKKTMTGLKRKVAVNVNFDRQHKVAVLNMINQVILAEKQQKNKWTRNI
jgi:hypothetical protein